MVPLQPSLAYPSTMDAGPSAYAPWDEAAMLGNTSSGNIMPPQEEYSSLCGVEGVVDVFHYHSITFIRYASVEVTFQNL